MKKILLPRKLLEISGIAWYKGDILGIEDENGRLYRIHPQSGEILEEMEFGKKGDYEDLLVRGDTVWILRSDGDVFWIKNPMSDSSETGQVKFKKKGTRDFETLLSFPGKRPIMLICKSCEWDKKQQASIFQLDPLLGETEKDPTERRFSTRPENLPDGKKIPKGLLARPSAGAVHPLTGEVFIISSAGKWLMILDQEFNPKQVFKLNSLLFKQPEGLTFDPEGNLYVSNEGFKEKANLLFFPYQP
ncbi:SdiA-regulated domain-containing protein [Algoriphagus confluentis]